MRTALLLAAFALSACASNVDRDFAGNIYPPQCAGDLTDEPTPVRHVDPREFGTLVTVKGNERVWGLWTPGLIRIDSTVPAGSWKYAEILRHERCHAHLAAIGLSPYWHR